MLRRGTSLSNSTAIYEETFRLSPRSHLLQNSRAQKVGHPDVTHSVLAVPIECATRDEELSCGVEVEVAGAQPRVATLLCFVVEVGETMRS